MYARRIKGRNQRWGFVFQQSKYLVKPNYHDCAWSRPNIVGNCSSRGSLIRKYFFDSVSSRRVALGNNYACVDGTSVTCLKNSLLRFYSSDGDGRNASEDNHRPVSDGSNIAKGKTWLEKVREDARHCDTHARLGEQDQKEWLNNEKLAIESKKQESPFLTRHEKFKNEFLRRLLPWEKIQISWETFPYYIHEHTRNLLVECVSSHLKHKKFTAAYGARLTSSSGRILLQSSPGTELYRERLVRVLARDLQVPLLVLDSSVLAPYDFGEDGSSEYESDDDNVESEDDCTSESEVEDENNATNEEDWMSSNEAKTDCTDDDEVDMRATAEAAAEAALKKLVPYNLEDFEKRVSGESESSCNSSKSEAVESSDKIKRPFKRGDRVKYIGPTARVEADNRPLSNGQRGEVYEVNGDRVAVILDISEENKAGERDEKLGEQPAKSSVYWINVKHIELDIDTQAEDCYIAMEVLCEVLHSMQPVIVYFPDSSLWLSRAVPKSKRKEFVSKVQEMFDQLSGPVVLICGQNKVETGSKEKEKFTMILPNFGRLAKLPLPLKRLTEGLKATKRSDDNEIYKLFTNVVCIYPPKEEDLLRTFNKQVEEDRRIIISRSNLNELHEVLEEHELFCLDLLHVNTDGVILTKRK